MKVLVCLGVALISGGVLGSFSEANYENMTIYFIGALGGAIVALVVSR